MTALRPLRREDPVYKGFIAALRQAGLPVDDLPGSARLYVLEADGAANGFGGLEGSGADQLIRSVVVSASARGRGHGRRTVEALARQAQAEGAERLWLLTTSASPFFAKLGWFLTDRAAPKTIRASRQFSGLCPASAVLMCRHLA